MVPRKTAGRKPRQAKKKQELFAHKETQTVWVLVKRSKTEVVLKAAFSTESRRPKIVTFFRDYEPMEARAGGVR